MELGLPLEPPDPQGIPPVPLCARPARGCGAAGAGQAEAQGVGLAVPQVVPGEKDFIPLQTAWVSAERAAFPAHPGSARAAMLMLPLSVSHLRNWDVTKPTLRQGGAG